LWFPFHISSFCIVLFRVEHEILTVPEHVILHPLWCPSHISSLCIVLLRVEHEILSVPKHVIIIQKDEICKGHHNGCKITSSATVRISCSTLNKTIQKDEIWEGHHNGCKITCSGTVRISCSTEARNLTSVVMPSPDFVLLYCFI
jgi:hypothetical protein